jgi:hypothetical protein
MEANASGRELLLFRLAGLYLQGRIGSARPRYAAFTTEFPESARSPKRPIFSPTPSTGLADLGKPRNGRTGNSGDMGKSRPVLRLSSILYRKTGSVEQASRNLRRYLSFHPDDLRLAWIC